MTNTISRPPHTTFTTPKTRISFDRIYIVADGSTGDIIAPVSVAREFKKDGFQIYGVLDASARQYLEHLGFGHEIASGQIRFAAVDYAAILQEADMAGAIRGQLTFLRTVSSMLHKTIPLMLKTWTELLDELQATDGLSPDRSIIVGNDLGATWLVQTISLYLGRDIVMQRFVSHNSHPWSPGNKEFLHHLSPHFIQPPLVPPALVNTLFRQVVAWQYAAIGQRFAERHARSRGMDARHIVHFKDVIDHVQRHYTFDPLLLSPRERQRQASLQTPVSVGGYAYDLVDDFAHASTREAIRKARDNEQRVISIALGSLTGSPANQRVVLDRLIRSCLDREDTAIILVGGYAFSLIDLTEEQQKRITLVPYENYIPLFSHSDLLLISGAAGTTNHTLVTGTPCICIPTLPDQKVNARWMRERGLSPGFIPYMQILSNGASGTQGRIRKLLNAALDTPGYHTTGSQISRHCQTDGLAHAVGFTRQAMVRRALDKIIGQPER